MTTKKAVKLLPVKEIELNKKVQVRKIDKDTVTDYTKAYQDKADMPPIVVFREKGSKRYVCADGHHRRMAAERAQVGKVKCDIREGTWHDALRYALGANHENGLRRTRKDKYNAVKIACLDPEFAKLSERMMADLCRVSRQLVKNVRDDLTIDGKLGESNVVQGADGKEYPAAGGKNGHVQTEENQIDTKKRKPAKRKSPGTKAGIELVEACRVIRTLPFGAGDMPDDFVRELTKNRKEIEFAHGVLGEMLEKL